MKVLIIYDSLYGSTGKIAEAMGAAPGQDAEVTKIDKVNTSNLAAYDLILVGSPTQGGKPSPPMQAFLAGIPEDAFKNKKTAAFDTRLKMKLVKIFGFAGPSIEKTLRAKGADIVAPPEGFLVSTGKTPVILEGEIERAVAWIKGIAAKIQAAQ
jgi:flavodoxin I